MGARRVEALSAKCADISIVEHVHDSVARIKVTALDERGLRSQVVHQHFGGVRHGILIVDLLAGENRRFVDVRRNESRPRNELAPDHVDCVRLEQHIARRRDHHRIEDVVVELVVADRRGDDRRDCRAREHPGLERAREEILRYGIDLRADHCRRDRVPTADTSGVLRCDGGDRGRPEHAESLKCLQVGLDPGSAARVGARDGERNLHKRKMRRDRLRRIINRQTESGYWSWRGGGDGGNDRILALNEWKLRVSEPSDASVLGGS